MGPSWWSYGLAGNEKGLATFLRYSREQGLSPRLITPAGLFAPQTLEATSSSPDGSSHAS